MLPARCGVRSEGSRIPALRDVTFDTREREFLSIVGLSGCGKTTLFRTLAGLIKPQQGVIEHIPSGGDHTRQVLLVSQENSLFP